jgi:cbb3-type cytochrome oxidase subunit 3
VKLSDVVAHSGLALYAEVALVLFLIAFVGVLVWTLWPSRRKALESHRAMPLDRDDPIDPESGDPS